MVLKHLLRILDLLWKILKKCKIGPDMRFDEDSGCRSGFFFIILKS